MSDGAKESGEPQIMRAAQEAAPGAQIVRSSGDLLVYYSGFNLSKFIRFLALQPHVISAAPMTADIAQIISQGYASGKTAAEIAEEVAREFDRAAQSNGDEETLLERLDDQGLYSKAERIQMIKDAAAEIRSLSEKLATAEANYMQFCKKHDEEMERMKKALEFIADGYDNQDVNHVDFRVKAYQAALDALGRDS